MRSHLAGIREIRPMLSLNRVLNVSCASVSDVSLLSQQKINFKKNNLKMKWLTYDWVKVHFIFYRLINGSVLILIKQPIIIKGYCEWMVLPTIIIMRNENPCAFTCAPWWWGRRLTRVKRVIIPEVLTQTGYRYRWNMELHLLYWRYEIWISKILCYHQYVHLHFKI